MSETWRCPFCFCRLARRGVVAHSGGWGESAHQILIVRVTARRETVAVIRGPDVRLDGIFGDAPLERVA